MNNFLKNESADVTLYFVHNQATLFQSVIKSIEKEHNMSTEVGLHIKQLKEQLQSRLESNFLPLVVITNLNKLQESNPGIKNLRGRQ